MTKHLHFATMNNAAPTADVGGLPIHRRLVALTVASAVGAVLFLPFLSAASPVPVGAMVGFVAATVVVAGLAAWIGLRSADAVALPMPFLRSWELHERGQLREKPLLITIATGLFIGAVGLAALRLSGAPHLPGSPLTRGITVVFAAVPLEIVIHLCIMSVVVRLTGGRNGIGIAVAAAALVLFHLTDIATQSTPVIAAGIIGNGVIGVALGVIYAEYGFEYVILGHTIAHLLTLLGG